MREAEPGEKTKQQCGLKHIPRRAVSEQRRQHPTPRRLGAASPHRRLPVTGQDARDHEGVTGDPQRRAETGRLPMYWRDHLYGSYSPKSSTPYGLRLRTVSPVVRFSSHLRPQGPLFLSRPSRPSCGQVHTISGNGTLWPSTELQQHQHLFTLPTSEMNAWLWKAGNTPALQIQPYKYQCCRSFPKISPSVKLRCFTLCVCV